jgi:transposase-like protein
VPKAQRTRGDWKKYDEEMVPAAAELASQGLTDAEIAAELGIVPSTLWRWFVAYPELRSAVKAAKDAIDRRVERSLFKRAVEDGDTTAHIFWLKNRQPEMWRDRKETEIIVPVTDDVGEVRDARGAALAALALFNEAQYDPGSAGVLLEATANAEESDDGDQAPARGQYPAPEQGAEREAEDDWERGDDLDPGEL